MYPMGAGKPWEGCGKDLGPRAPIRADSLEATVLFSLKKKFCAGHCSRRWVNSGEQNKALPDGADIRRRRQQTQNDPMPGGDKWYKRNQVGLGEKKGQRWELL